MSNASIASQILKSIATYESGHASASSVAESIELNEPALESIPREVRVKLHRLSILLIEQAVTPQEEAFLGISPNRQALTELKSLLTELA